MFCLFCVIISSKVWDMKVFQDGSFKTIYDENTTDGYGLLGTYCF